MKKLIKILILTSILISNIYAKKIIKYQISPNKILKTIPADTIENNDSLFIKTKINTILNILENNGYPLTTALIKNNNDTIHCVINTNKQILIKNIYSYKNFPYLNRSMKYLKGKPYSYKKIIDNIKFIKEFNNIDTLIYEDLILHNNNSADIKFYYKDSKNYNFNFSIFYKNNTILGKIYFKNFNFFDEGIIFSLNFNRQNINYSSLDFYLTYPYLFSYPIIGNIKFNYKQDKLYFTNFKYNFDLNYMSYNKDWQFIIGIIKEIYMEKLNNIYIRKNFLSINTGFLYKKNNISLTLSQELSITKNKKKKYIINIDYSKTLHKNISFTPKIYFEILTKSDTANKFNSIKINDRRLLAFPFYNIWTEQLFYTKQQINIKISRTLNISPFFELSYFKQNSTLSKLFDYGISFNINSKQKLTLVLPQKFDIDNIYLYYNLNF